MRMHLNGSGQWAHAWTAISPKRTHLRCKLTQLAGFQCYPRQWMQHRIAPSAASIHRLASNATMTDVQQRHAALCVLHPAM
jgi:hypothetical protein